MDTFAGWLEGPGDVTRNHALLQTGHFRGPEAGLRTPEAAFPH
jgi:hypothetical protein